MLYIVSYGVHISQCKRSFACSLQQLENFTTNKFAQEKL